MFIRYGVFLGLAGIAEVAFVLCIFLNIVILHNLGHQLLTTALILEVILYLLMLRMPLYYVCYGVNTFFQMDVQMNRIAQLFNPSFQKKSKN